MKGLAYIHPQKSKNYDLFFERFQKVGTQFDDSVLVANTSLATLLDIETTYAYSATVYDAIYTMAFAMLKAGSIEPNKVAANMRLVANNAPEATPVNVGEFAQAAALLKAGKRINYEGASGSVEFDEFGDVTSGTYIIWKVRQGKYEEAGYISFP
jgi:ABC-type branched-subunit amino acid transport system substrate-binding protein